MVVLRQDDTSPAVQLVLLTAPSSLLVMSEVRMSGIVMLAERTVEPPIRIELTTFSLRVSSDGIIWAKFGSSSLISRGLFLCCHHIE